MDINSGSIAIVIKGNNLLLDLRKIKGGAMWEVPGGRLEETEGPEDALDRELKEEVNLTVENKIFLGKKNQAIHFGSTEIDNFFLVKSFSGKPIAYDPIDKETLAVRWVNINDIKDMLNVSWRIVDALHFLSNRTPIFKKAYMQAKNAFDNRPVYSFEDMAYSFNSNNQFLRYKDYVDKRVINRIKDFFERLKPPILQINPGYGSLTNELVSIFGEIDAVELSPTSREIVKERFDKKVTFIDGIPEMFKSKKKYNSIVCVNSYIYQPSYMLFIKSLLNSITKNGKILFSPLELRRHIIPSNYISYRYSVKSQQSYQEFFSAFGFIIEDSKQILIDRLNNIKTKILLFKK